MDWNKNPASIAAKICAITFIPTITLMVIAGASLSKRLKEDEYAYEKSSIEEKIDVWVRNNRAHVVCGNFVKDIDEKMEIKSNKKSVISSVKDGACELVYGKRPDRYRYNPYYPFGNG